MKWNSKILHIPITNHVVIGLTFLTKHLKRDVTEAERRVEELMDLRREEQVSTTDIFSDVAVLAAAVYFKASVGLHRKMLRVQFT